MFSRRLALHWGLLAFLLQGLALALSCPQSAQAWGVEGHEVVATLAESRLRPATRAEVERILAQGGESHAELYRIANWADHHKSPQTGPWHYVNFPRGDCHYMAERDCPEGQCIVQALRREVKLLAHPSAATTPEQRLHALAYVVHFVGDIHQPLHAGYGDDRGGNSFTLQRFMQASNLHALWDAGIIRYWGLERDALAQRLSRFSSAAEQALQTPWRPENVAEESCGIVASPGFYPDTRTGSNYIDKFTPVLEDRLQMAAARLAQLLNQTLGD